MASSFWFRGLGLSALVLASMILGGAITARMAPDSPAAPLAVLEASPTVVATAAVSTPTATPIAAPSPPVTTSNTLVPSPLPDLVEAARRSTVVIEATNRLNQPSSGSGVVIDHEGHILTNYHVIEGQTRLKVTLWDGTASLAEVIGTDPGSDLAVIQVSLPSHQLFPAVLADSDLVRVGDPVFAIGTPFSQRFTVTSGIISATGRTTQSLTERQIRGVLQTDAAVNPGNSGGPLFNHRGEVIGINTSIENPNGRFFVGIGFAVPSNTALRFLPQMLAGETVRHAQLGVTIERVDEVVAQELGLSVTRGLYVTNVTAESAAERAGIRPAQRASGVIGDVIVMIDGRDVHTFDDLASAIDGAEVGDVIEVVVDRSGQRLTLRATLQAWDLN